MLLRRTRVDQGANQNRGVLQSRKRNFRRGSIEGRKDALSWINRSKSVLRGKKGGDVHFK